MVEVGDSNMDEQYLRKYLHVCNTHNINSITCLDTQRQPLAMRGQYQGSTARLVGRQCQQRMQNAAAVGSEFSIDLQCKYQTSNTVDASVPVPVLM